MTYREALEILEEESRQIQAKDEILAEMGSSYFYGGAQGWGGRDAMFLAEQEWERGRDREAEAAWDAKVREARRIVDANPVKVIYRFPPVRPGSVADNDYPDIEDYYRDQEVPF